MDENRLRFGVGVLVISAIGIGIILTFLFGAFPSVLQRDYSLSVVFDSAEGIGANTLLFAMVYESDASPVSVCEMRGAFL